MRNAIPDSSTDIDKKPHRRSRTPAYLAGALLVGLVIIIMAITSRNSITNEVDVSALTDKDLAAEVAKHPEDKQLAARWDARIKAYVDRQTLQAAAHRIGTDLVLRNLSSSDWTDVVIVLADSAGDDALALMLQATTEDAKGAEAAATALRQSPGFRSRLRMVPFGKDLRLDLREFRNASGKVLDASAGLPLAVAIRGSQNGLVKYYVGTLDAR
jgi:hypothetical protein